MFLHLLSMYSAQAFFHASYLMGPSPTSGVGIPYSRSSKIRSNWHKSLTARGTRPQQEAHLGHQRTTAQSRRSDMRRRPQRPGGWIEKQTWATWQRESSWQPTKQKAASWPPRARTPVPLQEGPKGPAQEPRPALHSTTPLDSVKGGVPTS